jgi:hypothetical protein
MILGLLSRLCATRDISSLKFWLSEPFKPVFVTRKKKLLKCQWAIMELERHDDILE